MHFDGMQSQIIFGVDYDGDFLETILETCQTGRPGSFEVERLEKIGKCRKAYIDRVEYKLKGHQHYYDIAPYKHPGDTY
jgi:hypothetical protein